MSTVSAFRRSPLIDPAFIALPDNQVSVGGSFQNLLINAQPTLSHLSTSPLNQVIYAKLFGTQLPNANYFTQENSNQLPAYAESLLAKALCALHYRDKDSLISVMQSLSTLATSIPHASEAALIDASADLLRLTLELYRRADYKPLLVLIDTLRKHLPDISNLFHSFPFNNAFEPVTNFTSADEQAYHTRQALYATGITTANMLAIVTLLSQYSGSARENASIELGHTALQRYHGMPCGAFSADPYLAGRNPSNSVELPAVCAQIESLLDALLVKGDATYADKIESLLENALSDLIVENGIHSHIVTNRLANDETCQCIQPNEMEVSSILRALYAVRKSVFLQKDDNTFAYMLPIDASCMLRIDSTPIRVKATVTGVNQKRILIQTQSATPVEVNLLLRIPSYANDAKITLPSGEVISAVSGTMHPITFVSGEAIVLHYTLTARVETGYRNSISIFVGPSLMAFPLPNAQAQWKYALVSGTPIMLKIENQSIHALISACEASEWQEAQGRIVSLPSRVTNSSSYELTLIPVKETSGRLSAFPIASKK